MISINRAKSFCKEDISKIENYDKAIADSTRIWHCHHRTEIWWNCSVKELKENKCYYKRKACELIFLTPEEHLRIHRKNSHLSEETRQKISKSIKGVNTWSKGKTLSTETRKKLSESMKEKNKGKKITEEHRRKIGEAFKGKTWKIINGKRVWFLKVGGNE